MHRDIWFVEEYITDIIFLKKYFPKWMFILLKNQIGYFSNIKHSWEYYRFCYFCVKSNHWMEYTFLCLLACHWWKWGYFLTFCLHLICNLQSWSELQQFIAVRSFHLLLIIYFEMIFLGFCSWLEFWKKYLEVAKKLNVG